MKQIKYNGIVRALGLLVSASLVVVFQSSFHLPPNTVKGEHVNYIVIDPGHGGLDPGCLGKISKEKDVALKISIKVKKLLKEHQPDLKVDLTRNDDNFVGLDDRAVYANDKKADLFISIHCNANDHKHIAGTETYVMGHSKVDQKLKMVMAENSVILLEKNHQEKYDGFNPKSEESYIMFKLHQHAYQRQSLNLASKVETHFAKTAQRNSRGVKPAPFWVLWKTSMPAILIETGFLTNEQEEKFMNSVEGQDYLATAIFKAIVEYRKEHS